MQSTEKIASLCMIELAGNPSNKSDVIHAIGSQHSDGPPDRWHSL